MGCPEAAQHCQCFVLSALHSRNEQDIPRTYPPTPDLRRLIRIDTAYPQTSVKWHIRVHALVREPGGLLSPFILPVQHRRSWPARRGIGPLSFAKRYSLVVREHGCEQNRRYGPQDGSGRISAARNWRVFPIDWMRQMHAQQGPRWECL